MSKKSIKDKKFLKVIGKVMKISKNKITKDLKLGSIPEWDSLAHLNIYFQLQKVFKKKYPTNRSKREVCERLD